VSKPTLKVTSDFTKQFNDVISKFKSDAVLVGIPQEDDGRDDVETASSVEGSVIGNAAILAIQHFGSEEAHIPPRPVLAIGVRMAQADIAAQFKLAAQKVWKEGPSALRRYYERAGTIAASSCKRVITQQIDILPPAESTLSARKYLTQKGFRGTKSLLVTGQLRNAITYVVQNIWGGK